MDNFLTQEEGDLKNLFNRFRKRNFSGNTGQAIKNSSYQLATNLITKIGSLLFTIIVARLLMPERMGLYSLALSTIIFFSAFSDFGIGTALMTFISKTLGKNNPNKAKAYYSRLLKSKFKLLMFCSFLLMASSFFISKYYYQKPIFYALLVGGLYLAVNGFLNFFEQLFKSNNNFKTPMVKEIILQSLRLTIVPIGIFLLLKLDLSNELLIATIFLMLTLCYLVAFLFILISSKKKISFLKLETEKLSNSESVELKKFLFPLIFTAFSGVFFGYIDALMLGHFVSEEYIAYYSSAFALISSAAAIIGFASVALFPLFSKLEGNDLKKLLKKSQRAVFIISILAGIFTFFFAYYIVRVAYGSQYLISVSFLKFFAVLLVILPLSSLYENYLISRGKTKTIAWLLIVSTLLNIALNYIGITYGLKFGMFEAGIGACIAIIISRFFYLFVLMIYRK